MCSVMQRKSGDDIALHTDGQANEENLQKLLRELTKVRANAVDVLDHKISCGRMLICLQNNSRETGK